MKVCDVRHGSPTQISLRVEAGGALPERLRRGDEVELRSPAAGGTILLRADDRMVPVRANGAHESGLLAQILYANLPRLVWVVDVREGLVVVQIRVFTAEYEWLDCEIGVDERLVDDVQRRQRGIRDRDDVLAWLAQEFVLDEEGRPPRVLMSASPIPQASLLRAFRVHGARWALDVVTRDDGSLAGHRLTVARGSDHPVFPLRCDLKFVDITVAGVFVGQARSELDALVKEAGSYLAIWDEYNDIEADSVLRRATAFGVWPYDQVESRGDDRFRVRLAADGPDPGRLWEALRAEDVEVALAPAAPPQLHGRSPERGRDVLGSRSSDPEFQAVVHGFQRSLRTVEISARSDAYVRPAPRGELYLSISGDAVRLDRRKQAFDAIAGARCPMPQLGLLIEGRAVPERRGREIEPLSPAALRAFGGTPTPAQREALRVALNTPDIALIQGPPGTGKTRTIAALQVRLAEIAEQDRVSRQILLTSFQHDAVENAASKTRVLGLPALKLGTRRGAEPVEGEFERWRRGQIEAVRADVARGGARPVDAVLRRVRTRTVAYSQAPSPRDDPAQILDDVALLAELHVPPPLIDRVRRFRDELRRPRPAGDERDMLRRAVRSLRTDAVAFADDGPHNALKALSRFEQAGVLTADERALLRRAADVVGPAPTPLLAALAGLRDGLLDRTAPRATATQAAVNADVERLLHEVLAALQARVRSSSEGIATSMIEYLDALENDPEGIREAILRYTAVLAATCQQAVGRPIQELKEDGLVFDTVIVDEAARANPLDLMIPMACAERRIVLVGDHRQLPHLLEPDVEQALDQGCEAATREALRRSLFERLFLDLRRRADDDKIPRTVTLDCQYRMHPVLGSFVSDAFYADHGEGFGSGTDAAALRHGLPGYGERVAGWIHVPHARGPESGERSKSRACEAEVVAQETREILEARPDLSVGVISFYAAQVGEILTAMIHHGLTERTDDGPVIRGEWTRTHGPGPGRERLRVGTVDAFQGMEFDVVLLSMTRSNRLPHADHRALRRKYGHLMLSNRLCVAMSRQQRLLVVVGDREMLEPPVAARELRGLVDFLRLCEGPHGVLRDA